MIQSSESYLAGAVLEHDHEQIEDFVLQLEKQLIKLRYEGKPVLGKNLKSLLKIIAFVRQQTVRHFQMEEKKIFPFLAAHIPRLEVALSMFQKDHMDLLLQLKQLENRVKAFKPGTGTECNSQTRDIKELGLYFIYFLKAHLRAEDNIVYESLKRQLRADEARTLRKAFK